MSLFRFSIIFVLFCLSLHAIDLNVIEKKIHVNGREATIFAIAQADGTLGLSIKKDQQFNVRLKNTLTIPTSVHWHGLILPNDQDGVAFITQYPIYPTQFYQYQFPLVQSGTFWMHSHLGLQEQKLLSAPLIIYDPEDSRIADQEVVVLFADFTFKSPSTVYQLLRCKNFASKKMLSDKSMQTQTPDIVDVDYDAYLTNHRTLKDPQIVDVHAGAKVRLRLINGSSATNFFINLGYLTGDAIAVDGNRIKPLNSSQFELADAQRIDIVVKIPDEGGAFPILAQAEGTDKQTGLILVTKNAKVPEISETAEKKAGPLTNIQEGKLQALYPLSSKKVDKQLLVELGGNMSTYTWTINGQAWPESTPLIVEKGQRIEMIFKNSTPMSHPMHLHGHVFQVKAIDEKQFEGALRDTVLVTPHSTLTIQFDANNPGVWPLHCHLLYHLEAGMLTVVRYSDFQQPLIDEAPPKFSGVMILEQ
ncbi:MAG: multicopper oxidase family protein [Chlamydiales bacterium]